MSLFTGLHCIGYAEHRFPKARFGRASARQSAGGGILRLGSGFFRQLLAASGANRLGGGRAELTTRADLIVHKIDTHPKMKIASLTGTADTHTPPIIIVPPNC